MYTEAHRNQYHFSPQQMWMNDPNGMVYYDGEYHLFFQYYPDGTKWGPMHWGHALSKDLMHWEEMAIALEPDELGYIFSGSTVVDWKNTSGLGTVDNPPLVAFFTHHNAIRKESGVGDHENQSIAYSLDKGRSWTKYANNPVIPNTNNIFDFRDPKVIWDQTHDCWIMVLAAKDRIYFYSSKNLIDWVFVSEWGQNFGDRRGVWECPDLFPMQVKGNEETKWILILSLNPGGPNGGSGTQYFVGDFDGKTFQIDKEFEIQILDGKGMWIDYGPDSYAGVTWSDIPKADGRTLFLAWMSNWDYAQEVPTHPWRSAMCQPRSLSLHKTENAYRLRANTVHELQDIHSDLVADIVPRIATENQVLVEGLSDGLFRLKIEIDKYANLTFGLKFHNAQNEMMVLGFDGETNNYFIDRSKSGKTNFEDSFAKMSFAPINYDHDTILLEVLIDHASLELIADGGQLNMCSTFFASSPLTSISLIVGSGEVEILDGKVTVLQSIWT